MNLGEKKKEKDENEEDKGEDTLNNKYLNPTENKDEKPKEKDNSSTKLFSATSNLFSSDKAKAEIKLSEKTEPPKTKSIFGQNNDSKN